jgi:hypothetical protein
MMLGMSHTRLGGPTPKMNNITKRLSLALTKQHIQERQVYTTNSAMPKECRQVILRQDAEAGVTRTSRPLSILISMHHTG